MAIVDFIVRVSPDTPIAPQILTRKARVRKNDGDLQGKIDWFCIAGSSVARGGKGGDRPPNDQKVGV